MADIDLQGRPEGQIPAVKEDNGAKATTVVERKPMAEADQKIKQASSIVELRPTVHVEGNEMAVLIQILSSINRNMAFLSRTVFEHLNPDKKEASKNG